MQIVSYILMSKVVFFGFAQSFFLGFYTSADGFQTLQEALMSMVRFTSGDVNFDDLQRSNTTLAPLLYTMALFVLSFVWTSLLLAIVISAYYLEVNDVRPPISLPDHTVGYVVRVTSGDARLNGFHRSRHCSTVALLNIEPLATNICGGHTQDRSVISRYLSHQILTPFARLRYIAVKPQRMLCALLCNLWCSVLPHLEAFCLRFGALFL
jgi:hypothetical protein